MARSALTEKAVKEESDKIMIRKEYQK